MKRGNIEILFIIGLINEIMLMNIIDSKILAS